MISRKKGKGELIEVEEEEQGNVYELMVSAGEEKALLTKIYNFYVVQSKIYLNNGRDIIELNSGQTITHASDKTLQLELEHPFLVQRTSQDLKVYNYDEFNHLFSIPKKATHCCLFNSAFLLALHPPTFSLWHLAKNECLIET